MNLLSLMQRFTIRFRMLGAIVVVMVLLALLGGAGMLGMFRIQAVSDQVVERSSTDMGRLTALRVHMAAIRGYEKDMIIQYEKPEEAKKLRVLWDAEVKKAETTAGKFLEGGAGAGDADDAIVRRLLGSLIAYRDKFIPVARQIEANAYDTATVANRMGANAVKDFVAADQAMVELETGLAAALQSAKEEQATVTQQTKLMFAAAVALTVAVVVPLTILNMQSICRPLEQARRWAQSIAGGDLSQTFEARGKDEVADLQRALGDMQAGLAGMVVQVRDSSESIANASQEIASGNLDLSTRTEQTASNVQETVSSLSELTSNVQQTASSAQLANQMAAAASTAAVRGGSVVQQVVKSMTDISASSRKINDIIGLIDSIAFQTNILALNAAVEAARAGEQGRGFAVVASEVRALAQRSAAAASEIKGLIGNSVTAVDGGVRQVQDAGAAMEEIVAGVQRLGDIIGEITAAASEQSAGIGEVNQSVNGIDRMTQQNAALVEESAAAAASLNDQAGRLEQVVQQFRLSDDLVHATHRVHPPAVSAAAPAARVAHAPAARRLQG